MEFYPCARPGRSGETTDDVPDEVVDKWASGLPKPKTPAPLDGPRRHCPALRAATGPGCTWARPALKARSSPNGSKAPPSRDDQPSRSPGPERPVFSGIITPDRRGKGGREVVLRALRGSQSCPERYLGPGRGAVRPVPRFPPRNRSPGRRRYPALRRPQPTPRVTSAGVRT